MKLIHRLEFMMSFRYLRAREMQVTVYHIKRRVPQDFFEGENVASIEQIIDSECVTAQVGM